MTLVTAAISIAISLGVFIIFAAVVEAMRRRGVDPVSGLVDLLMPLPVSETEEPV